MAVDKKKSQADRLIKEARGRPAKKRDIEQMYRRKPSIATVLPWMAFDDASNTMVLEDGVSCGVVYEVEDLPTDGQSETYLLEVRDRLQRLLQDAIPHEEPAPYYVQIFVNDEHSLKTHHAHLREYIKPDAKGSVLSETYLELMKEHFDLMTQPGGLFTDHKVTGCSFRGAVRRIRFVLYRRQMKKIRLRKGCTIKDELLSVCHHVEEQLRSAGLSFKRYQGSDVYEWLVRWFSPKPPYAKDTDERLKMTPFPKEEERPFGYDFVEQLFSSVPRSDHDEGVWWFDEQPHRFVTLSGLSKVPSVGHLSAEKESGGKRFSLLDRLPEGAVFVISIVLQHQSVVKDHLRRILKTAAGAEASAALTRDDCQAAYYGIAQGNALYPCVFGVYLTADTRSQLAQCEMKTETLLRNHGFMPIRGDLDLAPLDAYLRYLPFCYHYPFDQKYTRRATYVFARQIANVLPFYGRYRGTGRALINVWNRGGEPQCHDHFSEEDKMANSHRLVLGVTGSGKSAKCIADLMSIMAVYRPRVVIVEAGNSFGLMTAFLKEKGLSVNDVTLNVRNPTSLNPFADTLNMLEQVENSRDCEVNLAFERENEWATLVDPATEDEKKGRHEQRDFLGEMLIAALLMVTGGEKKEEERLTRADRQVVAEALIEAAVYVRDAGRRQMRVEDIVAAFERLSLQEQSQERPDALLIARMNEMKRSMAFFATDPMSAAFFNREGDPWPDVDVTRMDLDLMKNDGYEAQMALAFMGIMNRVLAMAEATQHDERMTIVLIDESHIITKNPLTAAAMTKVSKMSRKLGLWLWFATQNLSDFPDESRKMLSMIEFWECLGTSQDEIDQIKRFKDMTPEEERLFLSVHKHKPHYVEGVMLSPNVKGLFRTVPPRLVFALAGTDKDEKVARRRLMEQYGVSEVEAAERIAKELLATAKMQGDVS